LVSPQFLHPTCVVDADTSCIRNHRFYEEIAMQKILLSMLLLGMAAAASAQWGPPVPSPLVLAAIPGLSSEQQAGVRKILLQHRDAVEALASKEHAEMEALHQRSRGERERADDSTDASLRKLLGDEGYRKFAEWHLSQRGPQGPGPGRGAGTPHGPGLGGHPDMRGGPTPPPTGGAAPMAEDDGE
jgi:hypothetical protein